MQRILQALTLAPLLFALILFSPPTFARGDAAQAFEEGHAQAQERSRKGDWIGARKMWLALLSEHAGADFARPFLPEIREDLRRAAFWSRRRRPDPKQLIAGKLLNYSRTTGKVRVSYTPEQLADFEQVANFQLHPLRFSGSYTVEVAGAAKDLAKLTLMVGMKDNRGYMVRAGDRVEGAGLYTQHLLARLGPGQPEPLDTADPKERKASSKPKRVKLKISVSKSAIKVTYDGRSVLSFQKDSESLGRVGILQLGKFESLTLDGVASNAWLEDLVDTSVQAELAAFESSYTDPAELAAWEAVPVVKKSSRDLSKLVSTLRFPDPLTREQHAYVERMQAMTASRKYDAVAQEVAAATDEECTPATREFLLLSNALQAKRYSVALDHITALDRLGSVSIEMRIVEAILSTSVERRADAIRILRQIITDHPGDPALYATLAEQLLLEGELNASREQIDAGLAFAPGDEDLHELRRQLAKASQGPSWSRMQQAAGEFCDVATNIDPRTTRLIAREADQAIQHYVSRFGPLPKGTPKIKLYVFSGSSSYANYIAGVEADSPENTLGVFSPRLKQVLLWNQPDRPETFRVVRHEVMHAYADAVLGSLPTWFSEGNADYFAAAKLEDGRWKEGAEHANHLMALKTFGLKKVAVADLLYLDHPGFMRNAAYMYPMSWAFVDFLQHSTRENKALFDLLWKTLRGEIDSKSAVEQVFEGLDLERLNAEFWKAVEKRVG